MRYSVFSNSFFSIPCQFLLKLLFLSSWLHNHRLVSMPLGNFQNGTTTKETWYPLNFFTKSKTPTYQKYKLSKMWLGFQLSMVRWFSSGNLQGLRNSQNMNLKCVSSVLWSVGQRVPQRLLGHWKMVRDCSFLSGLVYLVNSVNQSINQSFILTRYVKEL